MCRCAIQKLVGREWPIVDLLAITGFRPQSSEISPTLLDGLPRSPQQLLTLCGPTMQWCWHLTNSNYLASVNSNKYPTVYVEKHIHF